MNILITGAFGMVGRELVRELEGAHSLCLLDREKPENATVFAPGTPTGRKPAPFETSWPCIQGEITDRAAMGKAVAGMDAVVHLAAVVTGFPQNGPETMHVNVCGTFNLLDAACREAKATRFVCASSINAFGTFYWRLSGKPVPYDRLPLDEDFPSVAEDPYSLSKLFNEQTCAGFTRAYGITTAAFRFAGVWPEETYRQRRTEGLKPTAGWSDDLYQWVHVKDAVRGIRQALEKPDLPAHGVYTLCAADTRCPEPSMDILQKFRPDLAAKLAAPIPGRGSLLSIQRAHDAFGFAPQYRLD